MQEAGSPHPRWGVGGEDGDNPLTERLCDKNQPGRMPRPSERIPKMGKYKLKNEVFPRVLGNPVASPKRFCLGPSLILRLYPQRAADLELKETM